jgi:hypothetical protein
VSAKTRWEGAGREALYSFHPVPPPPQCTPAGRETLYDQEGCSEEEVEEELAPLTVQLAYVLGRQGRAAEAQELYDTVRGRWWCLVM